MTRARIPLADRFWPKVAIGGPDDCWPFTGAIGTHGYGVIGAGGASKTITSHHAAFLLTNGYLPDGVVMHSCDNRPCCNPAHLLDGTQPQNLADMREKGRAANKGPEGEKARTAKLTAALVIEIRRRWDAGERGFHAEFNITPGHLWTLGARKAWRHLGEEHALDNAD
jgi:hypothetical protein